MENMTN